ncbi:MAG: GtrA family protein [Candidatus Caldarchaeum sp.]|nr:GtrA family protein [Candidatus Caldarchaeum sp.]MDW7978146.1 GtrA family protein [Candidatus Caldarchaeum sp.]MDW8359614.1 GtrA family protein [Candidatus Caldarchaeum sp.]
MDFKGLMVRFDLLRFTKFALVGGVGLVVNTVLLYLLTTYVFGERLYLAAAAISLEASILNNFLLNEYWTFRDRRGGKGFLTRMLKFHGSRIVGAATSLVILYVLTDLLGLYYLVSNLIAVLLGTAVNYLTSNFWVWQ